ncbi:hypothetical protein GCM10010977_01370 [Citricoccus zhacaiensis]|uniref:Uncharacterized protein n=1 Tax=Citricoccus zhacaiensis TaxID=489142 RepID=A0ABQ2LM36_9MICC|nr:hypothetical protein GCM10010977_01370 [Citricoccus zhacaiensis]
MLRWDSASTVRDGSSDWGRAGTPMVTGTVAGARGADGGELEPAGSDSLRIWDAHPLIGKTNAAARDVMTVRREISTRPGLPETEVKGSGTSGAGGGT